MMAAQPMKAEQQWEEMYLAHRGLLFRVLAGLARQGYPVIPADSMDLIHDFFAEAWGGLSDRYDAERASRITYVYTAFYRFARRRICRRARLEIRMESLTSINECPLVATQPDGPARVDSAAVRGAFAELSEREQGLLGRYFGADRVSERELAHFFGCSRYRVKMTLVDALAKLASRLGRQSESDRADWCLVEPIMNNGLTVTEAAALAGVDPEAVVAARERIREKVSHGLPTHRGGSHKEV